MNKNILKFTALVFACSLLSGCSRDINLTGTETIDYPKPTEELTTVFETSQQIETETETLTPVQIDEDAVNFNGHAYCAFNADRQKIDTYAKAEDFCREMGGYLAIISSDKENGFIYDYIKSLGYNSAYFGYSKHGNIWKWEDNTKGSYTNWADDQPDMGDGNNYAKFGTVQADGTWVNDAFGENIDENVVMEDEDGNPIINTKIFVCEWDAENEKQTETEPESLTEEN